MPTTKAKRPAATPRKSAKSVAESPRRSSAGGAAEAGASVGLVVLDIANPFFTEVARGAEDVANDAGYALILCNSDDDEERESRYLNVLERQGAKGLVVTPSRQSTRYLDMVSKRGMSVVLLDRHADDEDRCSVAVDNVRGGSYAARHLLAEGHERIAWVTGSSKIQQLEDRRAGVIQAIDEEGLDPDEALAEISVRTLNAAGGYDAVERLLAHRIKPTAVACANDLVALGVLRGLTERGVEIPADMAVVGYDDIEFANALQTPLTTVAQPKYALGQTAMRLLLDEIDGVGDHQHKQQVFTPQLVVRASSVSTA